LTIRIPSDLLRRLEREARRRGLSRSSTARAMLNDGLGASDDSGSVAAEARRQSLLVRRRRSERDALRLVTEVADLDGWR
jgi:hypothetical protein